MNTLMIDFIAFSSMWAKQIWPVIYQTALLAGLIFMITRHKKISASLRFGLWMLVPLRMLVMPIATVSLPVLPAVEIAGPVHIERQNIETGVREISGDTKPSKVNIAEIPDRVPHAAVPDLKKGSIVRKSVDFRSGIYAGLFGLWMLGVAAFSLRAIVEWYRINGIIRNGEKVDDQKTLRIARKSGQSLELVRLPRIICTKENISSFVHGIFKPVLVLPEVIIESLSEEQLLTLFTHEFTHLKRRDPLVGWIVTICQIFYFFHPGYYLARYYILLDREIACDESVISVNGRCKSAYAQALLKAGTACLRPAPKAVAGASYMHLKKRLLHIVNSPDNNGRLSLRAILALILMGLISIPGIQLTDRASVLEAKIDESMAKGSGITGVENTGMKHYRNHEWHYELDIPRNWSVSPSSSSKSFPSEVGRFNSYDSDQHELLILLNPEGAKFDKKHLLKIQKGLAHEGFGNFVAGDMVIGSRKVLILDSDKSVENETMSCRYCFIPHDSQGFIFVFGGDNGDEMVEAYDRIVSSFKIIEQPASFSDNTKYYRNDKWDFSLDIPEDWIALPADTTGNLNEVVHFSSGDDEGYNYIRIFRDPYDPKQSLHDLIAQRQALHVKDGVKKFITWETTIGNKDAVAMDFEKIIGDQIWNIRSYCVVDGTLQYTMGFGTTRSKDVTFELFDRVAKTFRMYHEPESNGFKHYESYEGAFSLDIPGGWNAFPHIPQNNPNEMIRFASNENGAHELIVIRNPCPADISLERLYDRSEKDLAEKGFGNFIKTRSTIGSKTVIKLDYDKSADDGVLNYRRYYCRDGAFLYVLEFSTSNEKDLFGLYDRMASTFEILEEQPVS